MCISNRKESEKETAKTAEEDDEADFRIYSILSYFIVLVVIGLPVWWYTTRVYRANLPITQMYNAELKMKTDREFGIPLSLDYDILISFVHPDPGGLEIELHGQDIEHNLQPLLNTVQPVADFVVKSQWLYLTKLGAVPTKVGDYYVLSENQLPHIITPLETKLWSHLSPRPSLNLIVYFPHCNAPLYIHDSRNRKVESNSFLSARWGGVYIMNPDKFACEKKLFQPDLQLIVSTFMAQLKSLFKIDNSSNADDIYELKMRKARELLDSTRKTLRSLAQLLSEISSIVISDEVGSKINVAVENADLADDFLKRGDVDEGLQYAKLAFSNAEAAFGHPSLLALLYFPEDQKYAVYIPLFLPIMIPVFMSLPLVRKWRKMKKTKLE
ncbi:phosphatidylinositol glycan anchor biosynthesis class S [Leptinotarsa decemlineata]|uniref:phosphatidylinositol glycan anchor biosynthesis class S n=1 Tax=Leptinotarsa decemlineata TaxID=7539 RepID=UPI003D30A94B